MSNRLNFKRFYVIYSKEQTLIEETSTIEKNKELSYEELALDKINSRADLEVVYENGYKFYKDSKMLNVAPYHSID